MTTSESRIFAGSIPSFILSDPNLWPASKLVYAIISGFAANNKDCFISNGAIASALGLTNRHVIRCIKQLTQCGAVKIKSISGQRTLTISISKTVKISTKKTPKGVTCMSGGGDMYVTANDKGGVTCMSPISTTSLKESTLFLKKRECTKSQNPISENPIATIKDCPNIRVTEKEKTALIARYKRDGLTIQDLKDGCEFFNAWLLDNQKQAAKLKSHYRCLIGWVLDKSLATAKIRAEKQSADMRLERSKQVHKMPLPGENPQDTYARKINAHRATQNAINRKTTGAENVGSVVTQIMARRQGTVGD